MTQHFENVLVDPDPYFDDWMAASGEEEDESRTIEASSSFEEVEGDAITIVSSEESNYGVSSFERIDDGDTTEEGHLLLASVDTSNENVAESTPSPWRSLGGSSVLSMSTADSEEEENIISLSDISEDESAMSVNVSTTQDESGSLAEFLSLEASSVPSSQLGQLPSVVSRTSADDMSTGRDNSSAAESCGDDCIPEWFAAVETDQDWESWRNEMLQVLAVLSENGEQDFSSLDPSTVDTDLLLAALISQQEELGNENQRAKQQHRGFWGGMGAFLASAALPVALALIFRRSVRI